MGEGPGAGVGAGVGLGTVGVSVYCWHPLTIVSGSNMVRTIRTTTISFIIYNTPLSVIVTNLQTEKGTSHGIYLTVCSSPDPI